MLGQWRPPQHTSGPAEPGTTLGGSQMLTSRPRTLIRLLALSAAAAFVLGMPVMAATEAAVSTAVKAPAITAATTSAPTTASVRSTSTLKKKRAHSGAPEEQNELNVHVRKLTETLKLSDDQELKVKSIFQARMTQAAELRAKFRGEPATPENRAAFEKARSGLRAETDAKLAQVFTADQMTEYRKLMTE